MLPAGMVATRCPHALADVLAAAFGIRLARWCAVSVAGLEVAKPG